VKLLKGWSGDKKNSISFRGDHDSDAEFFSLRFTLPGRCMLNYCCIQVRECTVLISVT